MLVRFLRRRKRRWPGKSKPCSAPLLLFVVMLSSCATSSPPTPPVQPTTPSPPVRLEPEHSQRYLPRAQDYSQKVQSWLHRVLQLTTPERGK